MDKQLPNKIREKAAGKWHITAVKTAKPWLVMNSREIKFEKKAKAARAVEQHR